MTKATKPVHRETEATVRSKGDRVPIIVSIMHGGMVIGFRMKKHRQVYTLPTSWCFVQAVEAHIQAMKKAKLAERKARRGQS